MATRDAAQYLLDASSDPASLAGLGPEELVARGAARGYSFTNGEMEDVLAAVSSFENRELSPDELDRISGGFTSRSYWSSKLDKHNRISEALSDYLKNLTG